MSSSLIRRFHRDDIMMNGYLRWLHREESKCQSGIAGASPWGIWRWKKRITKKKKAGEHDQKRKERSETFCRERSKGRRGGIRRET